MLSTSKKTQSNEVDINQKLYDTIYKKVTKKTHSNQSPKKDGDGTIKKCIELFNNGADPNVLIQLEKLLREQEEYQKYYIDNFLPALKTKVIKSEELMKTSVLNNEEKSSQRSPTRRGKILGIILEITGTTNKSSDKDHSSNPSYGLVDKERHRNRRLFGLHGVGNQNRKNMN